MKINAQNKVKTKFPKEYPCFGRFENSSRKNKKGQGKNLKGSGFCLSNQQIEIEVSNRKRETV